MKTTTEKSKDLVTVLGITKKDTKENRLKIRYYFNLAYLGDELEAVYGNTLKVLSMEQYNELASLNYIAKLNEGTIVAEGCFYRIFRFLMELTERVTHINKERGMVEAKNMPRYCSGNDMELLTFGIDELALFYQEIVTKSNLSTEEEDNWDLDMINVAQKVFGSEAINFDPLVTVKDTLKLFYGTNA